MKTAISIPDDIFKKIDAYAKEHRCSRSEVFVRAVREFLERRQSEKMLEALNKVYTEDTEDKKMLLTSKRYFRKKIIKE